jgi:hypothetical protein
LLNLVLQLLLVFQQELLLLRVAVEVVQEMLVDMVVDKNQKVIQQQMVDLVVEQ